VFGNNNWATNVQGTTPDYLLIRDIGVLNGASFTQQDVDSDAKVALLGQTVADNLFNGDDPIGQVIRIKHVPFTVVGTLVPKGQSPTGQDQDDIIIVPITTGQKKIFGVNQARANSVGSLIVQARGPQAIAPAQEEMRSVLRQRHHLQPQQDDDFTIRNLEEVFKAQETSSHVMSILLAAIASVSLVVGGIGIMNIMLVSVTERTKEIGIRKSIGARSRDILRQFLTEAVFISEAGGIVGILLGIIVGDLLAAWLQADLIFPYGWAIAGLVVCSAIGIGFGFYPAYRAASLDPIEALRFE
jgi:putative ABC transport system permease protein